MRSKDRVERGAIALPAMSLALPLEKEVERMVLVCPIGL
jgi:hypothetical protein